MLAERLATLEMRELNERQRADLAVTRYRQTKEALSHLEERNAELEERVSELSRKLLESQAKEGELSDRLTGEECSTSFSPPSSFLSFSLFLPSLFSFPLSNFITFLMLSPFDILLSPPSFPLFPSPCCFSSPPSLSYPLSLPLLGTSTKIVFLPLPRLPDSVRQGVT